MYESDVKEKSKKKHILNWVFLYSQFCKPVFSENEGVKIDSKSTCSYFVMVRRQARLKTGTLQRQFAWK